MSWDGAGARSWPLVVVMLASCGGMSERRVGDSGGENDGGVGGMSGGAGGASGGVGGTGGGVGGSSGVGGSEIDDGGASFTGGSSGAVPPMGAAGEWRPSFECRGVKTGAACSNEGFNCERMPCGLADVGRRTCTCLTNWTCSACDFANTIFEIPPANITTCTGAEQDAVSCPTLNAVCEGAPNGEVCACYLDDEGAQIWDCDQMPSTWGAGL